MLAGLAGGRHFAMLCETSKSSPRGLSKIVPVTEQPADMLLRLWARPPRHAGPGFFGPSLIYKCPMSGLIVLQGEQ